MHSRQVLGTEWGVIHNDLENVRCQKVRDYENTAAGSNSESDCASQCPAGYKGIFGSCSACVVGTYKAQSGDGLCLLFQASACLQLHKQVFVSGTCVSCVEGKYKFVFGDVPCASCKACKYSSAVGATSVSTCLPCGAGTFSAAVGASLSKSCVSCETGKYAEIEGGIDSHSRTRGTLSLERVCVCRE